MSAATSPGTGLAYGLRRVCAAWGMARSSFYAMTSGQHAEQPPAKSKSSAIVSPLEQARPHLAGLESARRSIIILAKFSAVGSPVGRWKEGAAWRTSPPSGSLA